MFKEYEENLKVRAICEHFGIEENDAIAIQVIYDNTKGGKKGLDVFDDKRLSRLTSLFKIFLKNNKFFSAYERLIVDPEYRERMFQAYNEKISPAMERLSNVDGKTAIQVFKNGRIPELEDLNL